MITQPACWSHHAILRNEIMVTITTALYAGSVYHVFQQYPAQYNPYPLWGLYSISAQNGYVKSSWWPWQHPGESPTYILHKDTTYNTRERFFLKLSINNHIVGLVHKNYIVNEIPGTRYRISTSNERVWCTTQLETLSFNHSIGRTHSWRFPTFHKILPRMGKKKSCKNKALRFAWTRAQTSAAADMYSYRLEPREG